MWTVPDRLGRVLTEDDKICWVLLGGHVTSWNNAIALDKTLITYKQKEKSNRESQRFDLQNCSVYNFYHSNESSYIDSKFSNPVEVKIDGGCIIIQYYIIDLK